MFHNCQHFPQPFCVSMYHKAFNIPNPNKFDYFMSPEQRSDFQLPLLFTQIKLNDRHGSVISNIFM